MKIVCVYDGGITRDIMSKRFMDMLSDIEEGH